MKCKHCGSNESNIEQQLIADGRVQLRETCASCGRFLRFAPQHKSAGEFMMPFGKHKGETVEDIFTVDPEYLVWASENLSPGRVLDVIVEFLEARGV